MNKVLVKQFNITQQKEIHLFQMKVPSDAEFIVGVEASVNNLLGFVLPAFSSYTGRTSTEVARNVIAGTLMLQSCGPSNLFYHNNVVMLDSSINYGGIFPAVPLGMVINPWSHSQPQYEDEINISDGPPMIAGMFKDTYTDSPDAPVYSYRVNVYVWYKRKEVEHDN